MCKFWIEIRGRNHWGKPNILDDVIPLKFQPFVERLRCSYIAKIKFRFIRKRFPWKLFFFSRIWQSDNIASVYTRIYIAYPWSHRERCPMYIVRITWKWCTKNTHLVNSIGTRELIVFRFYLLNRSHSICTVGLIRVVVNVFSWSFYYFDPIVVRLECIRMCST